MSLRDNERAFLVTTLVPAFRLGPYEIQSALGRRHRAVYRATDINLGRQVAIKVLPEDIRAGRRQTARFEREAKTLAPLNHPNIPQIRFREGRRVRALVIELVEGIDTKLGVRPRHSPDAASLTQMSSA